MVDIKFMRAAPGFVGGKNGMTHFGTDPKNPWGSMRHAFWPRANVEGRIITKDGEIDFKGRGMFSMALQGMKPHHAGEYMHQRLHASTDDHSCSMELCQFPISNLFRHLDGVHYSSLVCIYSCPRERHCYRRQAAPRQYQRWQCNTYG